MNVFELFERLAPGAIATIAGVGYRDGIPAKEADAGWPMGVVRRDDGDLIVSPTDPWPLGDEPIAVDFHGAQDCALEQMETLLELADVAGPPRF